MVDEAHRLDRRVAAHAMGKDGIMAALDAGRRHHRARRRPRRGADGPDDHRGRLLVPDDLRRRLGRRAAAGKLWQEMRDLEAKAFGLAVKKGVKIAYGTDVGGYPWTENQAKEFSYMVNYGMTPMQAIRSATVVAAELLEAEDDLGAIEAGKFADIVAVTGDPLADIAELEQVKFVMKGGEVFKNEIKK